MAMVTLTSPCNTNLSQALSNENNNNNNLRDASFSSYLNGAKECFVLKLAESSQDLTSFITSPHEHLYLGRNKIAEDEIGVFSAEKYLNGGVDEENPRYANSALRYQYEKDEPVDQSTIKTKHQPQFTPSVHSELSWNSRNSLLHSVQRNPVPRKANKGHGKSFLASIGRSCSCGNKNSVDIDESVCESNSNRNVKCGVVQSETIPKEPIKTALDSARINKSRLDPIVKEEMKYEKFDELGLGLQKEDCFSFPSLSSKARNHENGDDKARKSSEVFGSPILEKGVKPLGLERRLSMLNWDSNPRVEGNETSAYFDAMYNDIESDTSSDLFEIESITNNANPSPCFARQASDGMSSCVTPTTCYAPSEASIEWSVVTASTVDFSVVSDNEELRTAATTKNPNKIVLTAKAAAAAASKEVQRRRPGILGCKSHKAVRIAGDAYRSNRTNEEAVPDLRWRYKPESFAPVTRFQAEAKLTGF